VALGAALGSAPDGSCDVTFDAFVNVLLDVVRDVPLVAVLKMALDAAWKVASGAACATLDVMLDEVWDVVLEAVFDLESDGLLVFAPVLLQEAHPTTGFGVAACSNILHTILLPFFTTLSFLVSFPSTSFLVVLHFSSMVLEQAKHVGDTPFKDL